MSKPKKLVIAGLTTVLMGGLGLAAPATSASANSDNGGVISATRQWCC